MNQQDFQYFFLSQHPYNGAFVQDAGTRTCHIVLDRKAPYRPQLNEVPKGDENFVKQAMAESIKAARENRPALQTELHKQAMVQELLDLLGPSTQPSSGQRTAVVPPPTPTAYY